MITVLHTHSISWAESVRVALLGSGVEAVLLDPYSPGTLGLAGSVRVAIVNDGDLERARNIVAELRPPRVEAASSWWWHKRALVMFGVAFLVLFLGTRMADDSGRPLLTLGLLGFGATLFAGAIAFLLVGYRADKRRTKARLEQDRARKDANDEGAKSEV